MAQQTNMTAVEWLDRWFRDNYEATYEEGNKAFEQAKKMEKEQIVKAANTILYSSTGPGDAAAEQYYNETYGKK